MIPLLICVGVGCIAFGVHATARLVQRYGTDLRSAGTLIELRQRRHPTIHPADFDLLDGLVADSLNSDAHWHRQLVPFVEGLADEFGCRLPAAGRDRIRWLTESLDLLEEAAHTRGDSGRQAGPVSR